MGGRTQVQQALLRLQEGKLRRFRTEMGEPALIRTLRKTPAEDGGANPRARLETTQVRWALEGSRLPRGRRHQRAKVSPAPPRRSAAAGVASAQTEGYLSHTLP